MASTMRAVLFHGPEKGFEISSVPKPQIRPGDLLVKICAAGLCHSDFGVFKGNPKPKYGYPIIPGHEATGVVEEVGEGVSRFKPNDRVGFLMYYHNCGKCLLCAATPIACPSAGLQGFTLDGYFAEYALIDADSAIVLPESLDLVSASPLFCAGLTAFHAVDQSELEPGQWIAIVGIGGLGHLAVQYAKVMGFRVAAIDIDARRLESAKALGAEATFNTKQTDAIEALRAVTGGGVHASVCLSGSNAAYETAAAVIRPGGTLMVVGISDGKLPVYSIPIANGLMKVKGASSGWPGPMMEKAIKFSADHGVKPHITSFTLDEFPKMVEKMESGDFEGRMVVVF